MIHTQKMHSSRHAYELNAYYTYENTHRQESLGNQQIIRTMRTGHFLIEKFNKILNRVKMDK